MTMRLRPFVYAVPSVGRTATVTLACLTAMLTAFVIYVGAASIAQLSLVISCVLGSVISVLLYNFLRGRPFVRFKRSVILCAVVEGIITAMILPLSFPPLHAAVLVCVFTIAAKHLSVQESAMSTRSALNVSVLVACTAQIVGGESYSKVEVAATRLITPITDALNSGLFSLFSVTVPEEYISLFWTPAAASSLSCYFAIIVLLSSLVLNALNMAEGMVQAIFCFVYLLLVRIAGPALYGNADVISAALSGGLLFYAVFVLSCPGTLPMSRTGRVIYAASCGVLAFFIQKDGRQEGGIAYAILCGNIISILIQYIEDLWHNFVVSKMNASLTAQQNSHGLDSHGAEGVYDK